MVQNSMMLWSLLALCKQNLTIKKEVQRHSHPPASRVSVQNSRSKFARHEVDSMRIRFPEVLVRVEQGANPNLNWAAKIAHHLQPSGVVYWHNFLLSPIQKREDLLEFNT